ncbi:hypothetical protein JGU71_29085 [Antrihabitans sp. YC3-6]|uniref:Uncharacterized protein n=1 Tax=Antrihabitans stalagmiti TaxID=2799499 RepID=A0A934U7F0_9NOCA|nr:hypothetical protein [Antrihabitans stalagmiti]MBJ8342948.1 hypothetical protein [Antrihabitans stalagmiti]
MSIVFLYASATEPHSPSAALGCALDELQRQLLILSRQHRYVVITSHSHTLAPTTVISRSVLERDKPGWLASVTAAVDCAELLTSTSIETIDGSDNPR